MRSLPSLTALRVFETAGKTKSFTLASEQLHVTQGAVSRQVKQLEEYLGVPLFIRKHHKLELTTAGQQLLLKLERSFNLIESAVNEIRDPNQRQKLTILAPPTFATRWLSRYVGEFRQKFKSIDLAIHSRANEETKYDITIRFGHTAKPRHFSELLFLEHHVPVCIPELLERSKDLSQENDLLLHVIHERKKLPFWENWLTSADLHDTIDARLGTEFDTLDQAINALGAGAGFAIIDRNMIEKDLEKQLIVKFSDVEVTGPFGYWLDISTEKQGLAKVIHFTRWLREKCATKEHGIVNSTPDAPIVKI